MDLTIPQLSLVLLIGPAGAGKSTFARTHFAPTQIVSSDACRAMVCDDEADQSVSGDAFDLLHYITAKRLHNRRLTVIDATNVLAESRRSLLGLSRKFHVLPVAIVFDYPESVCQERNRLRRERQVPPSVISTQINQLRQSLPKLRLEGFHTIYHLTDPAETDRCRVHIERIWTDRRDDHGPFDLIGDVHGCAEELHELLTKLGYRLTPNGEWWEVVPPPGRKVVLLGDLVDRGPDTPGVLRLAMSLVRSGHGLCVQGNHDRKLARKLAGRDVHITPGLAEALAQLANEPPEFCQQAREFLEGLVSNYTLDGGRLVVAHAGLKEDLQGRVSTRVRDFALYGETIGETDEVGLPILYNWASEYRGEAMVVYGHTPVLEPEWLNRTICIDTGCVYGGRLTALRYPELELVSVQAKRMYCQPKRPLIPPGAQPARTEEPLELADFLNRRLITTRLVGKIVITEEQMAHAIEIVSRSGLDPRQLLWLPADPAPVESSTDTPDYLEHPHEAANYFRNCGVNRIVCQQLPGGVAVGVLVCRDPQTAQMGFRIPPGQFGSIWTGSAQLPANAATLAPLLHRLAESITAAGWWQSFRTDWFGLQAILAPGPPSHRLALEQLAAYTLGQSAEALRQTAKRPGMGVDPGSLADRFQTRQRLCQHWLARTPEPPATATLRLIPLAVLLSNGAAHTETPRTQQMDWLNELACASEGVFAPPPTRVFALDERKSLDSLRDWWDELCGQQAEGVLIAPEKQLPRGERGPLSQVLKARTPYALRQIYGPEYDLPINLERLRRRSVGAKRMLANRLFGLSVEAIERYARREPLRRVHECCLAMLALQSEPFDIRL
jgi:protein phosphatase